uniref:Uncharacterized protein involved in an early stage of isoprenoid biosynthesis n=1 Tax=uncultured Sphingobacteriales bacterium HF0130_33B19 TaxID=710991 RepID=E0XTR7_9SPHI|nr:uncharacterized protein involved in an early stage of isoprenoid biosynthesis [uncultured Sphingobacteriales bacterium HF0130_33B19]
MKTAVLLSGCGVYDGAEIHESVCALLALSQNNLDFICTAPDLDQHHVINHVNGEEINAKRNVLIESARIARGDIVSLVDLDENNISSLVIPGGFGAAKNLSEWAFKGPDGHVLKEVKDLILHCIENKKPIVSLCISPTLIAKSLEDTAYIPQLTLGSTQSISEYDIAEIHEAISSVGAVTNNRCIDEVCVDENLKIISAPCYMLDAQLNQIYKNIKMAIDKLSDYL